jgi:hypothetical protein
VNNFGGDMSITAFWGDEAQTILMNRFEGQITIDDYVKSVRVNADMMNSVGHAVDLIMDATTARLTSQNMFSGAGYADRTVPANQRLLCVVGASMLIKTMLRVAKKIAPKATDNLYFFDTMEQAQAYLQAFRDKLPQSNQT